MTSRRHLIILIAVLAILPLGRSQNKGTAGDGPSIYRNFVGNWEGSSERMEDGKLIRETEEVVITEVPKKHQIRLDYVYHSKNGAAKNTRFLELNPENETMKMHDSGFEVDRYNVSGLKQFAQNGSGDFTAFCPLGSSINDHLEKKAIERVTFHIGTGTLKYEWAHSDDGLTFKTYSMFSFKRVIQPGNGTLQPPK